MKRVLLLFTILLLAAAPSIPPGDLQFATTASMANLYEIMAGKLAKQKVTSARYKEFAAAMVTQHTEIGNDYTRIAKQQRLPMPTALTGDFLTLYTALENASKGKQFESLYRTQMIDTHKSAVPLFCTEAVSGEDAALLRFARKWQPTILHHLEMAEALPPIK